nr:clathrin associated protein complex large subunit [Polyrhizophydium stewartii]
MLLLDENQETLTLVTNCLKKYGDGAGGRRDMNNSNMFIVGLALCTLGNIASQEMARDLSSEVERLLGSTNSYLRKKAALCALRIIRKVPDLVENFLERTQALLSERNHGVLLTGVTLLTEMCQMSPQITAVVRENVPILVRHLKTLVTAGSSPEHDVGGITDPFLQVKILRLLHVLGAGDVRASEAMNDVLAQVATSTEASKNVGNAILYETVLTIMNIESESSLRVLGINILGRFLSNRDNNIKYVALTTLTKTSQTAAATDASALQRHRSTVLECLRDPDISIRRRALDLSFYLINATNIRILMRELLSFLEVAEADVKSSIATRICDYAGRYRPNKRWEIDTVTRVLRVAGAYVDQSVINHFIKLVSTGDTAVHQYTVRKLYNIVKNEGEVAHVQEGLLQAAFWCIGEYGDVLVSSSTGALGFGIEEDAETDAKKADALAMPTESEVLDLVAAILRGPYATNCVKEYTVTCLVKLCARFTQPAVLEQAKALIARYRVNIEVEIQQRAVEFTQILELDRETRVALLEPMPVLESAVAEEALKGTGASPANTTPTTPGLLSGGAAGGLGAAGDLLGNDLAGLALGGAAGAASAGGIYDLVFGGTSGTSAAAGGAGAKSENIMNLLGGIGLGGGPAAAPAPAAAGFGGVSKQSDLLGDLFGGGPPAPAPAATAAPAALDPLADLFGGPAPTVASTPAVAAAKAYPSYNKLGLSITLTPTKESATATNVVASFYNSGAAGTVSNLSFLVAIPKSLRLENPSRVPIRLRLKIAFTAGGQSVDEIVEFSSFEPYLWT